MLKEDNLVGDTEAYKKETITDKQKTLTDLKTNKDNSINRDKIQETDQNMDKNLIKSRNTIITITREIATRIIIKTKTTIIKRITTIKGKTIEIRITQTKITNTIKTIKRYLLVSIVLFT